MRTRQKQTVQKTTRVDLTLDIKTADELVDAELEARWNARRAHPHMDVLRRILGLFAERGGPIPVAELSGADSALRALDADDLIRVQGDAIDLAYPFSASPTSFTLRLTGGRERFAVCAVDALGVAPMLGEPVCITTECHHCGAPLTLPVMPEGPAPETEGIMVWVGQRQPGAHRIAGSL